MSIASLNRLLPWRRKRIDAITLLITEAPQEPDCEHSPANWILAYGMGQSHLARCRVCHRVFDAHDELIRRQRREWEKREWEMDRRYRWAHVAIAISLTINLAVLFL